MMTRIKWIVSLAATGLTFALLGSCTSIECGEGTHEENGVCFPDDSAVPGGATCPDGTAFDILTRQCVALPEYGLSCGLNTEEQLVDGEHVCVGTGTGGNCDSPISCPAPSGTKLTLCGQLYDTETNAPLRKDGANGTACPPGNWDATGPCSVNIAFVDPLAFVANPGGTPPLEKDLLTIDDCGRFVGKDVARPANGFIAVATGDAADDTYDLDLSTATEDYENYRLTGVAFPQTPGEKLQGKRAMVTRVSTDDGWTSSAGNPFGISLTDQGVYMAVFEHGTTPVAGVQVTAGGSPKPDNSYYFADTDPAGTRANVDADATSTGPNGAALLFNSPLGPHSGTDGEPTNMAEQECEWPTDLAATIANVVYFSYRTAHLKGDADTVCD